MPEMDEGIKRLVQTHPADMLALALPGAQYLSSESGDVATEPQLVLDTLLRVRYLGEECLVDLEAEARPKPDIGRRLFEYGARASIVHGLPVVSVVLWLEPGGRIPRSPYEMRVGGEVLATWRYHGIPVFQLSAQAILDTGHVGLFPLVAFSRERRDFRVIERTAELIDERTTKPERDILIGLLGAFGSRRLGLDAIVELFRRFGVSYELLETSPLFQELARRAEQRGEKRGEHEGLLRAVLIMLRGRFGEVSTEMEQAVRAASTEVLQDVLAHPTEPIEQVRTRLGLA